MKSATVEQLQHDPSSVLRWVEEGERVEISTHGRVVAVVSPPDEVPPPNGASTPKQFERPDFAARLKKRFPNGPIPGRPLADDLAEERDRY